MTADLARYPVLDVFLGKYHGACCFCCDDDWCSAPPVVAPDPIFRCFDGDRVYLTDRYLMIDAALVDLGAGSAAITPASGPADVPGGWKKTAAPGPEADGYFQPARAALLLKMGLHIGQGADDEPRRNSLWLDGKHVGWLMQTRSGGAQVPTVRKIMALVESGDIPERVNLESEPSHPVDSVWRLLGVAADLQALGVHWIEQP